MTRQQEELIIGKLLGDGSLENRGTAHSRLQIRHSYKQREYVDWCYRKLVGLVCATPKRNSNSYYFRTKSLPVFTQLRRLWYVGKKKSLPTIITLSPLSLAIWYMDDGYYDRVRHSIWFCTHCFNRQELKILQNLLKDMGLESGIIRDRRHFKIRILSKYTEKFIALVKPFISPSMYYKIGIAP